MGKSNRNIKLGVFVIFFSLLFTVTMYKLSGGNGLINSSITVYAKFENVEGLIVGGNVRFAGVNVGRVKDITVNSENVLTVSMSLQKEVTSYMKSSSKAEINTNGLVGNMIVNIHPEEGEAPLIQNGDVLMKKESREISDMLETLSASNEKIAQISEVLLQITDKINSGSGTVAQLLNDESIAKNLKATTRNLSTTSRNIRVSTDSINNMIAGVAQGDGNLGYLLQDNSFKTQMTELSLDLDSLLNERAEPILKNLELSSEAIANTSRELESTIKEIHKKDGLVGTLLQDTTLAYDLKSTLNSLNQGTQKFDESMEALQHNWLLRGFFKKKEKEAKEAAERDARNASRKN